MDPLWNEVICSSSVNFLSTRRLTAEAFINDLLQAVSADASVNTKLVVLGILQEKAGVLFTDSEGVLKVAYSLINTFVQQRNTGPPLVCSQILCTIAAVVIQVDQLLRTHEHLLVELVGLLFDVVEKVKTDSNYLLRSVACECLRELEMAFPGLLCSKVGHFFGMSQAENSYIHQSYMVLFSTVLEHAIQMFMLDSEAGLVNGVEHTLGDLLSYSDPLKSFILPERFFERANMVLRMNSTDSLDESVDVHEIKKGVSFLLEHCPLMTPACLALVIRQIMCCVHSSALAPKMLKSLMIQYSSCFNMQMFYLVLQLKLKFGSDICDEGDQEDLMKRLQILACHPCLPTHQRCLLFQWLLCCQWEQSQCGDTFGADAEVETPSLLHPTVFDQNEVVFYKLKLLSLRAHKEEDGPFRLKDHLMSLLKLVGYGILGDPAVTLYCLLFTYYTSPHGASLHSEIARLLVDIVTRRSVYIPHTIDFLQSVERLGIESNSSFLLSVLAEFSQKLLTCDTKYLMDELLLQLSLLKYIASHTQIKPKVVLRVLTRVLREGQDYDMGSWETGTAVLDVCNTLMRHHETSGILKDLTDLLRLIPQAYGDIDIQDRARFYHQLVLTVSGAKLSAILTLASDAAAGSSLSDIVEARISNAVFPSAPPMERIEDTFLSLTRLHHPFEEYDCRGGEIPEGDKVTALGSYLKALSEGATIPVSLQYRIHFSSVPDKVSKRIYALVLKIQSSGPYHTSPDVYVPFLTAEGTPGALTTSKIVTLTIHPKEPVPQTFRVSAVFTSEDGLSCVTELPPLKVMFEDLFLSVPKALFASVSPLQLFNILWSHIDDSQDLMQAPASDDTYGAVSTVHLKNGPKSWDQCREGLEGLRVFHNERTGEERLLIFVPPRFHFLCHFDPPSRLLLATDYWKMLPLINTFIQARLVD